MPKNRPCRGAPDAGGAGTRSSAPRLTQLVRSRESRSTYGRLSTRPSLVDFDNPNPLGEHTGSARPGTWGESKAEAIPPAAKAAVLGTKRRSNGIAASVESVKTDRRDYCDKSPNARRFRSVLGALRAFSAVLSAMSEVSMIRARCVSERPQYRPNGPSVGASSAA